VFVAVAVFLAPPLIALALAPAPPLHRSARCAALRFRSSARSPAHRSVTSFRRDSLLRCFAALIGIIKIIIKIIRLSTSIIICKHHSKPQIERRSSGGTESQSRAAGGAMERGSGSGSGEARVAEKWRIGPHTWTETQRLGHEQLSTPVYAS
jgi:hypothetical protein